MQTVFLGSVDKYRRPTFSSAELELTVVCLFFKRKNPNPLSHLRLNIFLILNLECILKDRRSVQLSQALTTCQKANILILRGILWNNFEKEGKIGGKSHLAEGKAYISEVFCSGALMMQKTTLMKKDSLTYNIDNDFDPNICLLFDSIK